MRAGSNKSFFEKAILVFLSCGYKMTDFALDILKFVFFFKRKIPQDIKKIVIFRSGNIGDIICIIPSLEAIRRGFRNAEIVLFSSPGEMNAVGAPELLGGIKSIDRMIIYYTSDIKGLAGKIRLIKKLRRERFDLFINLPTDLADFNLLLRDMIFAKAIGCRYACGFRIATIRLFLQLQSKYLKFEDETKRLLGVIEQMGIKTEGTSFPLPISENDIRLVNEFLGHVYAKPMIAINHSAHKALKIWPFDRFAAVGKALGDKFDANIILIGGEREAASAERLRMAIGRRAVNTAGKFTVLQTAELLRRCDLLISNDSGAIHMAVAVKAPVVGIYTSWILPGKWFPYEGKNVVLRKEPKCHACYREYCEHITCLKMITVEDVCEAAERILSENPERS